MFSKKISLIVVLSAILVTFVSISVMYAIETTNPSDQVVTSAIPPVESTLNSNRYTQADDLTVVDENPYVTLKDHEFLGTNSETNVSLYVHPDTLSLRIVNETTGYIWGSNMDHDYLEEGHPLYDPNNPQTNRRQDISPVSIAYYNTSLTTSVRQNEYFFEGAFDGSFVREDLTDKIGFLAHMQMPRTGIRFDLIVYLDDEGLHVLIPYDSVKDNGSFLISTITVYRNFGFTKRDSIPGYVFIPDGIGALIRYDESFNKNFSKKFYGPDMTLGQQTLERYLTAGVYGTVQGINQNGMLVILESGAPAATLTYQSHSQNVLFNKLYTTFEYRDKYIQRLNASGTSTIEMIQADKNVFDIHYVYQFLDEDDANYVGFSNSYRTYLQNHGINLERITDTAVPLHLDILALENKSVWYGKEVFKMTTTNHLSHIMDELTLSGIDKLYTTIHGWQNDGLSKTSPNYSTVDSRFGDLSILDKPQIEVYYGVTPRLGFVGGLGYQGSDVVQNQGSELIGLENYYLLNPSRALSTLEAHYQKVTKKGVKNLSLEDANLLYSDYNNRLSRSESVDILKDYLNVSEKTIVNAPMDYLFSADVIKEIELYSSGRIVFTDTVPFLTLVLSGHKIVFGRSSNFFANTQNELLRMIDYQVYPNFYITNESAQKLLNTDSNYIFTSRYLDWKDEIIRQYHYINEGLKHVMGSHIVKREVLAPGFIVNTYHNGVLIYVNYSGNDYTANGIMVPKMSYEVSL